MESHEWKERDEDGVRYYRANFHANHWGFLTTTQKRDPVWERVEQPSEALWRALRDIVWRKYQRKRCPWERVAEIDNILGDTPPPRG